MTTALYRRYRPETFEDVIGQEHVTEPLMTALRKDRVSHAYLFSGPRGCGKTTSARILARCLNCAEGPTATPCGRCDSCRDLSRDGAGSLDVIEMDAASHGGVDHARDLRERATFAPVRDRYKIFIIDEAHMVTREGFNALLKIVEEPPEHIKFIFATTEPSKVLTTIRSRTHHYPFRLVPTEPLMHYLEKLCTEEHVQTDPGVLSLVVRAGGGSVRDTLSVLDQLMAGSGEQGIGYDLAVALLGYTHGALLDDVVDAFASGDAATVFRAVDRVIQTGQDPRRFVEDLLERFRDLIIVNAVPETAGNILHGMPQDQIARLRNQASQLGAAELSRAADITNTALTEMTGATSPQLHLELLCARVLLPSSEDTTRGVTARVDRLERRLSIARGTASAPIPEHGHHDGHPTGTAPDAPAGTGPAPESRAPEDPAAGRPAPEAPVPGSRTTARPEPSATRPEPAETGAPQPPEPVTPSARPAEEPRPDRSPQSPAAPAPDQPEHRDGERRTEDGPPTGDFRPEPGSGPAGQPPRQDTPRAGDGDEIDMLRASWPEIVNALADIRRVAWFTVQRGTPQSFDGAVLRIMFDAEGDLMNFPRFEDDLRQAVQQILGIDCRAEAVPSGGGSGRGSSGRGPGPSGPPPGRGPRPAAGNPGPQAPGGTDEQSRESRNGPRRQEQRPASSRDEGAPPRGGAGPAPGPAAAPGSRDAAGGGSRGDQDPWQAHGRPATDAPPEWTDPSWAEEPVHSWSVVSIPQAGTQGEPQSEPRGESQSESRGESQSESRNGPQHDAGAEAPDGVPGDARTRSPAGTSTGAPVEAGNDPAAQQAPGAPPERYGNHPPHPGGDTLSAPGSAQQPPHAPSPSPTPPQDRGHGTGHPAQRSRTDAPVPPPSGPRDHDIPPSDDDVPPPEEPPFPDEPPYPGGPEDPDEAPPEQWRPSAPRGEAALAGGGSRNGPEPRAPAPARATEAPGPPNDGRSPAVPEDPAGARPATFPGSDASPGSATAPGSVAAPPRTASGQADPPATAGARAGLSFRERHAAAIAAGRKAPEAPDAPQDGGVEWDDSFVPGSDDEAIEDSTLYGRAAIERILGGTLVEERDLSTGE